MSILKRLKYLCYFFLAGSLFATAQARKVEPDSLSIGDKETIRIDSVVITGNSTTKDFIILRELTFSVGDTVSGKTLRYDKERVFSLGLFTHVEFIINKNIDNNILRINVSESWYIYPLPVYFSQDGDIKKSTYGVSLLYKNFRGRNETVRTSLGFGYDPFYSIEYSNPALNYEHSLGINFAFAYMHPTNRSVEAKSIVGYDYQSKVFSQAISISKRFDQYNLLTGLIGFDYIENPISYLGLSASGGRIDRSPIFGATYVHDSRDLKQFSRDGLYTFLQLQYKGFDVDNISYALLNVDYREYRTIIGELAAKWRLNWGSAFGKVIPFYDYSYLGYRERVRGHLNDIREGKNYILTSIEMSYPLIMEWNVHFKLPLLPESLTSYRIDIYATSFYDAGETYNVNREIALTNFYSGYGLGLTLLVLPYNAVRIEYARNELGRGEIIFGLGFSF